MPTSETPIRRIRPDDVPFSSEFPDADMDWILKHSIFDNLDPSFHGSKSLQKILRMHSRIVRYEPGEIIVREGDWGNSAFFVLAGDCLLYTSPSPRDRTRSRMPSSA